ncbi:MAG: hypothetical protein JO081_01350 [Alphaproteobacteria bacterium]|nr:hypothetical protein [Alphaproteobacteria bacterium]
MAARFLAQGGHTLAKSGAPGAQGLLEENAVLSLGAAAMLGSAPFQGFDNVLGNVANKELPHIFS